MFCFDAGENFGKETDFVSSAFGVAEYVFCFFPIMPEDSPANEGHAEVRNAQPGKFSTQDIGDEGAGRCRSEERN